jgi:cytochrome c-type biogenesis protein CcmH/NrfF
MVPNEVSVLLWAIIGIAVMIGTSVLCAAERRACEVHVTADLRSHGVVNLLPR